MTPVEHLRQKDRLKTISRCPACGAWVSWRHQPAARRKAQADTSTCHHQPADPHRLTIEDRAKGKAARRERDREARQARFENARFLMECATPPSELARRVGTSVEGLRVQARRWGAEDIAAYMTQKAVAA